MEHLIKTTTHSPPVIVGAFVLLLCIACVSQEPLVAMYSLDSKASIDRLTLHAGSAELNEVSGVRALALEGLLLLPEVELADVGIEVEVFAEKPCYPGMVFRFTDPTSFELAYAVPHASGQPDAIQYDPVFHGSNTWQLHSGTAFQQRAEAPIGEWFTLRIDVVGERAMVQVGDQAPLVVERLSHGIGTGQVGLWTYRPAFFRNLEVGPPRSFDKISGTSTAAPAGIISRWHLVGTGAVDCEPGGVLNLNRYLAPSEEGVRLVRRFSAASAGVIEFGVGFSDRLVMRLDGELLYEGDCNFTGFDDLASRGWVQLGAEPVRVRVEPGEHELEASLEVTEPFGWGLIVTLSGQDLQLLPVEDATP